MPQLHLPLFPGGATEITETLSFSRTDETITYFQCGMPVFSHERSDRASFRLIAAQLHVTCGAKQAAIARAFGVPQITIKRAVKQYRAEGIKGFFAPRVTRGASVLTDPVLQQAQSHLDEGQCTPVVAELLGIKANTLSAAIRAGRLRAPAKKTNRQLGIRCPAQWQRGSRGEQQKRALKPRQHGRHGARGQQRHGARWGKPWRFERGCPAV